MKKSKEIILTIGEILEHYLPTIMFIALTFGGILITVEALEELDQLQVESETTIEGCLILLLGFMVFSFMFGLWSQENTNKLNNDNESLE